jgi:hypothetical protein
MSEQQLRQAPSLTVRSDRPLIGVILEEQGQEVVHYFTEEALVDAPASDQSIQEALSLAGAWRDLDWDEAAAELERIRHQSRPTPPIDSL